MVKKERCVFLFGAGATLQWGSPLTSELTEMILKSGFKITGNKKTITQYIYDTLLANGFKSTDINFETIINVIEELIVYYGNFNLGEYRSEKALPSLMRCFFKPSLDKKLLNFSIKGDVPKHNYQLQIPKNVDYPHAHHAQHNEPPEQFFFQHLLEVLLTDISARISEYAYHTSGHSAIVNNDDISTLFSNWMKKLTGRNILRLYTLNYERIFKVLMEKSGISVFEGFDCGECVGYTARLRANVKRILSDTECNTHYNLHGSAFWEVLDLDKDLLPNPEIVLTAGPNLQVNNRPASLQVEKGKTIMVTNIVTGYQKAQKAMLTPIKQMQAAFDKDCSFADHIYIVGYSLGDEHINESIKTAIRHNPTVKISIIDPFFIKNDMDLLIGLKYSSYKTSGHFLPKNIESNVYGYLEGTITVYTLTFEEFLKRETDVVYRFQQRTAAYKKR